MERIEQWLSSLTIPSFYLLVFILTAIFSLIGYSCSGKQEREDYIFNTYNTMVDMCNKQEYSVAVQAVITTDSLLIIKNLTSEASYIYNLKNTSSNEELERAGYSEYLGFTDKVALNYTKKALMVMNSSGCVYVFVHKIDRPSEPSQYNRRG